MNDFRAGVYFLYWRGLLVVGLIQWAMREPRLVERRRSNSTFFILYLSKPIYHRIVGNSYAAKLIRMDKNGA